MSIDAKATMFFSNQDNQGWSESHYITASDILSAQSQLNVLIPLRLACLTNDAAMIYARVSDVHIRGDSLLAEGPFPSAGTYIPGGGAERISADIALLIQEFASPVSKGHFFLRQLTTDVANGLEYLNPSAWTTALNPFLAKLKDAWSIRRKTAVGPPPTYAYDAITDTFVIGIRARKVGRPFGLPVGRRRAR